MSDEQGFDNPIDLETLAFEYASGLLRGREREEFEQKLAADEALRSLVHEWEERLMPLADETPLQAQADTWNKIDQRVNPKLAKSEVSPPLPWVWAMFGAMASVFVLLVFPIYPPGNSETQPSVTTSHESTHANVDYVAVMTTANNQPSLTTFGDAESKALTLHWQLATTDNLDENQDFQLWAVSKRDGQTRSIGILADQNSQLLQLTPAIWRLITDAESLILTKEEAGGSAIDEPSEALVAAGICVRIPQKVLSS